MANKNFKILLLEHILINMYNDYRDNYDFYRYGTRRYSKLGIKQRIVNFINSKLGYYNASAYTKDIIEKLNRFNESIDGFEYLHNLLNDDYSKDLVVKVLAYKILGETKVKLPMNNSSFWDTVKKIEAENTNKKDSITVDYMGYDLYKINLNSLGYNISFYYVPIGIYYDFVYRCYDYPNKKIKVTNGDIVIDAGGCYGDTALYFAHEAGNKGHVYSFEFIPSNISIWNKNISLNNELSKSITLVEKPIWNESNLEMFYKDFGPGSKVSFTKDFEPDGVTKTITIDDLVSEKNINKLDFIKMDIEGAELNALKGAEKSIIKFKPKLAISLYHSLSDYYEIPKYLKDLNLGYKFYFNHYTMHHEESVLFAIIE